MFISPIFRTSISLCDRNGSQTKGCCALYVAFTSPPSCNKRLTKLQQLHLLQRSSAQEFQNFESIHKLLRIKQPLCHILVTKA
jgi:hypothetical protein